MVWFNRNCAILAVSLNKIPMVAVIMREGARSIENDYVRLQSFTKLTRTNFFLNIFLNFIPTYYPQQDQDYLLYGK